MDLGGDVGEVFRWCGVGVFKECGEGVSWVLAEVFISDDVGCVAECGVLFEPVGEVFVDAAPVVCPAAGGVGLVP